MRNRDKIGALRQIVVYNHPSVLTGLQSSLSVLETVARTDNGLLDGARK